MRNNNSQWIAAFLLGSGLAVAPAAHAAEKDMMKDDKGMVQKGAKDAQGMMKDEKGMKGSKDAMSKDKMKAEKTGKAMADDKMKTGDKMKDEKMKMDSKKN